MTEQTQAPVPAGWYPDSSSGGRTRWWDGAAWTEHFAGGVEAGPGGVPTVGAYGSYVAPSKAPEGTSTATPFIWIIVTLPLVSMLAFLGVDFTAYITGQLDAQLAGRIPPLDVGYLLLQLAGVLFYLASALLAYFDWRALGTAGVPRPFFWAWSFLGSIVYVIGRSVVVHRRTGGGLAPLWAFVAVYVVSLVVALVKVVSAISVISDYVNGQL